MIDFFLSGVLLAAAYGLGSISPAYLVAKWVNGVDIRKVGSLNAGALNVFRESGVRAGAFVLATDAVKGATIVGIAHFSDLEDWAVYGAPIALVIGHNWPIQLQFRGGRGLAPALGISMAMLPLLSLPALILGVAAIILSRSVVVGAVVGFVTLNVLTLITDQSLGFVITCAVITILVGGTHFLRTWRQYMGAARSRNWPSLLRVE